MNRSLRAGAGSSPAQAARVPAFVWGVSALFLGLLLLHGLLAPLYQAPDEPEHVDAALLAARAEGWPLGVSVDRRVVASQEAAGFERLPLEASAAPPRAARPSFEEFGPSGPSDNTNQMTQHPPLYYAVLAVVARALGDASYDVTVGAMRLVSIALVLPLPLLAYLASRRVSDRGEVHVTATLVPLAIPQLTHIGAVVNSDNLLALLLSVLTVLLLAATDRPQSLRVAVATGAVAGLALLTKGFALMAPAWIVLGYGIAWRRHAKVAALRGALALAVALLVGGWWWARNYLEHGTLQPYGIPPPDRRGGDFVPLLTDWAPYFVSRVVLRFWGSMGWFDVDLPPALAWLATGFVLLAVGLCLVRVLRRQAMARGHVAVLLFPICALLLGVAWTSWGRYAERAWLGGIQGRYLFGGVVGLAVVLAAGLAASRPRLRAVGPAAVAALALTLQSVAAVRLLRHYWSADPGGGVADRLASMLAWSPWPRPVAVLAPLLAVTAGCLLLARVGLRRRGSPQGLRRIGPG